MTPIELFAVIAAALIAAIIVLPLAGLLGYGFALLVLHATVTIHDAIHRVYGVLR